MSEINDEKSLFLVASCDYISGHLRGGTIQLDLRGDEVDEFNKLSEKDKLDYIENNGELNVEDWRVNDFSISDYEIQ